jgi:hypothetical protein
VYAFLNSLPQHHQSKYFYSSTEPIGSHAIKLNLLADMACFHSTNDNDWLMFIDGDAFPIADIVSFSSRNLSKCPLLAIQRKENNGDRQPHPSFCLTTVKFWKEINGDWKHGCGWRDSDGNIVTDVGGNLLGKLEEKEIKWLPLVRSNKRDIHELWFGIYGDLIYHHGAGFRRPVSRIDLSNYSFLPSLNTTNRFLRELYRYAKKIENRITIKRISRKNKCLAENIYQSILTDTSFYHYFQETDDK